MTLFKEFTPKLYYTKLYYTKNNNFCAREFLQNLTSFVFNLFFEIFIFRFVEKKPE